MNKTFIALAIVAAAADVSAQSSVTVYGSLDQGITKGNGGTAPNDTANGTSKAWIVKQSTPSRLGFRGNEDLGGGLSAQFQIEHRFTPDDGVALNPFWTARSYVQLSQQTLGRIYLGREYTPAFWPAVKSDPFGWVGVAEMGATMWAGYLSTSGPRSNNTIGYKSPDIGGLTVQVATGLGEGVTSRADGFNAEYGGGPIYAGLGYEKQAKGPPPTDGNSVMNAAFHYDFGAVKPMLYVARAKVAGGTQTNTYASIGILAPIGAGKLKAAFGRLKLDRATATGNGTQNKLGVGYDYALSKRTNLYLDASVARKAGTVNNIPGGPGFTNNTAYALGMNHTF